MPKNKTSPIKFSQIPAYSTQALPEWMQAWKDAIESGATPAVIAQCYHPMGLLKGTISGKTERGREAARQYFTAFIEGKGDITVTFHTLSHSPSGSFSGEYTFTWIDDDGQECSAEANYTFESATFEGRDTISLHHSSFKPDAAL